jgi:hypothetical protein
MNDLVNRCLRRCAAGPEVDRVALLGVAYSSQPFVNRQ